jgi:putative tryptophan/tyrosine transport system permease protein
MLYIIKTALQLGCVYSFVALALFISYRILNIADLTTDGSFVLGMAVSVSVTAMNHPILGIILGMLAGCLAGLVTAMLQTKLGVPSILAGIISNTGLYTINLMVMGWSSNLSLLKSNTIFTLFKQTGIGGNYNAIILVSIITILMMLLIKWFLSTKIGLSIRATGDNEKMTAASSINPNFTILIGLMISNALTGLSGALVGQLQKSADINAGTGIVTIGLATLIIGEAIIQGRKSISRNILACLVGNIVYRLIYAFILQTHIIPIECLKLMTAFVVTIAIAIPYIKSDIELKNKIRRKSC